MTELGIGIVGCGRFGQLRAQRIQATNGSRVVAVADPELDVARAFGATLGVPAYPDHRELLADPEVQAVVIATPHSVHEEVAVAAARAGKHVFCEKPMALDVASCRRMIDAADRHGVKLMVGHPRRLYPTGRIVSDLVSSGRVGQISAINVAELIAKPRGGWWARAEIFGGVLHSPTCHAIDFLLFICGRVRSVYAVQTEVQVQSNLDYPDSVFALIEFESGAIANIAASFSCWVPERRWHVIGTSGSLMFDADLGGFVELDTDKGERERIEFSPGGKGPDDRPGETIETQSFVDWVTRDIDPGITAWDGLRVVEVVDAAYRSIREKRPIDVPLL